MMAGLVDAYALIRFDTYVSFMSGNTTSTGSEIGQSDVSAAIPGLQAIGFFVIGVFVATLLTNIGRHRSRRLLFGLVAALLAVIIGVTELGSVASGVGIMTLSLAMGIMNTTVSHVGAQSVSLGYVTGTLNNIAMHVALAITRAPLDDARGAWDTHRRRAFLLAGVWAAFLTGALLAGAANSRLGVWVLLLPFLILTALALFGPPKSTNADSDA
jgi:uncharacterized membrane protein YoaK (UPF0700 family)